MAFQPKNRNNKPAHVYKTLYITEDLVSRIDQMAQENNTSFNNIVISMIEYCLNEEKE